MQTPAAGATPNPDNVRSQLARVTSSKTFVDSVRLTQLLTYLVEEALAERGPQLKEYKVGLDVFDRPESFDPRSDSIVRAQGTRLRSKLAEYYSGEGAGDPVEIELPRGSYAPLFKARSAQAAPVRSRRSMVAAVAILAGVALAAAFFLLQRGRTHSPAGTSVAVLPFVNMSADKDNDYFSDGLTEEIIDALAKVDGLRVVARTSAFQFKGRAQDIRQIGKALNVGTILEGSVRKTGNRLRITAQLNDVANGYHLWSRTFDSSDQDIFRVQSEIAGSICRALLSRGGPSGSLIAAGTTNLEAHNLYLLGLYSWNQWTREAILKGLEHIHKAIELDADYAQAYALLSEMHNVLGGPLRLKRDENMRKALASAQKALELNANLAEAHLAMGMYHAIYSWDWGEADKHLARAAELEPGSGHIQDGYGWYKTTVGQFADAEVHLKRAVELDPLNFGAMSELASLYLCQNRLDEGQAEYRKVLELDPKHAMAQVNLIRLEADLGRFDEAERLKKQWTDSDPAREKLMDAYIRARRGDRAGALKLMAEVKTQPLDSGAGPVSVARVYMSLGDTAKVIEQLRLAYDQRDSYFVYAVCALREFRPLYSDPRFIALKKKIGK